VAPSRKRKGPPKPPSRSAGDGVPAGSQTAAPTGRRQSKHPLIVIARAQGKEDVLAGLERWKARHPEAAALLEPADVMVDAMRGRSQAWYRIRLNLRNVPEELRPKEETVDPDFDPWTAK
jgi:hypothetical protein